MPRVSDDAAISCAIPLRASSRHARNRHRRRNRGRALRRCQGTRLGTTPVARVVGRKRCNARRLVRSIARIVIELDEVIRAATWRARCERKRIALRLGDSDRARIGRRADVIVLGSGRRDVHRDARARELDARDGLDYRRSADVAHADEEDPRHRPMPAAPAASDSDARRAPDPRPYRRRPETARAQRATAIAKPCSSARNCSSDSARSSGVRASAATGAGNPRDRHRCRYGAGMAYPPAVRALARECVARPRNRRAAEIQRVARGVPHDLDAMGIEQFRDRVDRRRERRHRRAHRPPSARRRRGSRSPARAVRRPAG